MGSRMRKEELPKPEFPEEFHARCAACDGHCSCSLVPTCSVEEAKENVEKDFYIYLNVSPDCGEDEIKSAYKRLAMIWHPDR